MSDPFSPNADYKVPKGDSKYLKFEDGQTEFLPLAGAVVGWEYWDNNNKPVRLSEKPEVPLAELPNIRAERDGSYSVKHFWAFPVIDCVDGKVKVLEITQKSVQKAIRAYIENPRWGSPVLKYSFTVKKEGSKLDTEYEVMANPASDIPTAWVTAWNLAKSKGFNINALFIGDDPFEPKKTPPMTEAEAEIEFDSGAEDTATPPDHEEEPSVDIG